jgi:putative DNA-binding protein
MGVEKPGRIVGDDGGPLPETSAVADVAIIERASATPIARAIDREIDRDRRALEIERASASAAAVDLELRDLLGWFSERVMNTESSGRGPEIEAVLTEGPRLTAKDRLGIYQYAYRARLTDCLADDYPVLEKMLGRESFEALAAKYIGAHPSRSPNLNGFGKHFAAFCLETEDQLAADLARLEWAMVEVLHAPQPPPITVDRLTTIGEDDWGKVRLVASPSLRFLELAHPVNAYVTAVKRGECPARPARAWSATAVYRDGLTIWRMDFTRAMAGVLKALLAGATLGDALDTLDTGSLGAEDGTAVEGDVMAWFRAWLSGGFFSELVV